MTEEPIDRFIRITQEKVHAEVECLFQYTDIYREVEILGRLGALSECIRFARTCKEQYSNGVKGERE